MRVKGAMAGATALVVALLASAGGHGDRAEAAEATPAALDKASKTVEQALQPLIARSEREGLQGKVLADDLPALPFRWPLADDESNPSAARFLGALRTVIRHAACDAHPAAIRELDAMAAAIQGFFLTEPQALYLERRAKAVGIEAPFHRRMRQTPDAGTAVSSAPQQVLRIGIAFDEKRDKDARRLVPSFDMLCRG